jgi:DNA helicase IV
LVDEVARSDTPYKSGRLVLRARLISAARRELREADRIEADQDWYERELVASDGFKALLDQLWPAVSPTALVSDVLTKSDLLKECAVGILNDVECQLLLRSKGKGLKRQAWAADDLALIDEADSLITGRSRTYGHIVVDEAQDLSPMQLRMLARRAPGGSLTILGDLAQATSAWQYDSWDEILQHLPTKAEVRRDELSLGYRAPGQVLDLASKLLPEAAPSVRPTRSIRRGRHEPRILPVGGAELLTAAITEAERLALAGFMVGVIFPLDRMAAIPKSITDRTDIGLLDRDGMDRAITIVSAPAAKGLEFDAAVVVEPAEIAGTDIRGLRLLYIAMTRPIQHLSIVHAQPLPRALTEGAVGARPENLDDVRHVDEAV